MLNVKNQYNAVYVNTARKGLGWRGFALGQKFCQQKAKLCSNPPLTVKALVEMNATAIKGSHRGQHRHSLAFVVVF